MRIKALSRIQHNGRLYLAGEILDVSQEQRNQLVGDGVAVDVMPLPLTFKSIANNDMPANVDPTTWREARNRAAHGFPVSSSDTAHLVKFLGLKPQPKKKLNLVVSPETSRALKSKQLSKDLDAYFTGKNIPVSYVAGLMIALLNYSMDVYKDEALVAKLSNDLLTLKRLTDFYYEQKLPD